MHRSRGQNVMVIGGNGFIGRHTVTKLVDDGHTVTATYMSRESPPVIKAVTWIRCDLLDPKSDAAWPSRCDSLIYLAQSTHWRSFPDGAADVFEINVAAAVRAVEYARRVGARRFIYLSTGSVYTQTTHPAQEGDAFDVENIRNFYFASKLAAEILLKPYTSQLPILVLRLFVPYGPGQDSQMLIPDVIRRIREDRPVSLHGTDGLYCNPVAVTDVAEALSRCLFLEKSGTYNVAGPAVLSLRDIGLCIGKVVGKEPKFEAYPHQKAPIIVGETSALRAALGWSPQIPFESGLSRWLKSEERTTTT
jgi:UDP-glucose 4-epimerase